MHAKDDFIAWLIKKMLEDGCAGWLHNNVGDIVRKAYECGVVGDVLLGNEVLIDSLVFAVDKNGLSFGALGVPVSVLTERLKANCGQYISKNCTTLATLKKLIERGAVYDDSCEKALTDNRSYYAVLSLLHYMDKTTEEKDGYLSKIFIDPCCRDVKVFIVDYFSWLIDEVGCSPYMCFSIVYTAGCICELPSHSRNGRIINYSQYLEQIENPELAAKVKAELKQAGFKLE